ncbi:MAG: hypothetical protein C4K58_00225 [Flavobacteriaceae bacterium]|nr:MAG: hypothetical protein C4K58_00225 [Flavobacteriaceae bacterium]
MKKGFLAFVCLIVFWGCNETLEDYPLPESEPRLVIQAVLLHYTKAQTKGFVNYHTGNIAPEIKLSTTLNFGQTEPLPVEDAKVWVTDKSDQITYVFAHDLNGSYRTENFVFAKDHVYTLEVEHQNQKYSASYQYQTTPIIDSLYESNDRGLTSKHNEVNFMFKDSLEKKQYYYYSANLQGRDPKYRVFDDDIFSGSRVTLFYENKDLTPLNFVYYSLRTLDENSYYYYRTLTNQANPDPLFTVPSVPLKGNIINQTNPDNPPLGYFGVFDEVVGIHLYGTKQTAQR